MTFQGREECFARAGHAAFHSADRAIGNPRCVFVREASGTHQNERFALFGGKRAQRPSCVGKLNRPCLFSSGDRDAFCGGFVPWRLAPSPPSVGVELIAQNCEEPCFKIRSWPEGVTRLPSFCQRLLRQIVRQLAIAAERTGKCPQERNEIEQVLAEIATGIVRRHRLPGRFAVGAHAPRRLIETVRLHVVSSFLLLLASIFRKSSRKSSGTGSWTTSSYMRRNSRPIARCRARAAMVFSLSGCSFFTSNVPPSRRAAGPSQYRPSMPPALFT